MGPRRAEAVYFCATCTAEISSDLGRNSYGVTVLEYSHISENRRGLYKPKQAVLETTDASSHRKHPGIQQLTCSWPLYRLLPLRFTTSLMMAGRGWHSGGASALPRGAVGGHVALVDGPCPEHRNCRLGEVVCQPYITLCLHSVALEGGAE